MDTATLIPEFDIADLTPSARKLYALAESLGLVIDYDEPTSYTLSFAVYLPGKSDYVMSIYCDRLVPSWRQRRTTRSRNGMAKLNAVQAERYLRQAASNHAKVVAWRQDV